MKPSGVKRFNDDLKAALIARVPIELRSLNSKSPDGHFSPARLDEWERLIQPRLEQNESLLRSADSLQELPIRYRAALQVFDRTGSMGLVLDGLSVRTLGQRQIRRVSRWAFLYLMTVLAVAIGGLVLFWTQAIPAIENMRADLLLPAAMNPSERFDLVPWVPLIIAILGGSFGLLLVGFFAGGATRVVNTMGGRHFIRYLTTTTALRAVQMLLLHGTDVDSAVSLSCDLTDATPNVRRQIRAAAKNTQDVAHLGALANYSRKSANQQLGYLRVATPFALVAGLGGAIALVYCLAIFSPIIALLMDMGTIGT